jgi:hypothetical protein
MSAASTTPSTAAPDNTIDGLRTELFATLRGLRTGEVKIEQAKAVSDLAQTIINSAKVEVDAIRATGGKGSSRFLPNTPLQLEHDTAPGAKAPGSALQATEVAPGHRRYQVKG